MYSMMRASIVGTTKALVAFSRRQVSSQAWPSKPGSCTMRRQA